MRTWIGLFRGINVGGHHKVPMKDLVTVLRGLGFEEVRSYIQSGNVLYLYAPQGIGRSKFAARAATLLGVAATARNWRTMTELLAMARSAA